MPANLKDDLKDEKKKKPENGQTKTAPVDGGRMKRLLDVVLSALGLVLFAPLLALLAVLVKCTSRGPVFFRQERIGRGFKPFRIYKLRTMRLGAEGQGLGVTFKGDNRITGAGRFLRKYKLDELPQLFNVLMGDMSMVGPRPEIRKYVEMFREDFRTLLAVRPGITDPASVRYLEEESMPLTAASEDIYINRILPEKIRLSKDYIREKSVIKDIGIIFGTVFKSWGRAGLNAGAAAGTRGKTVKSGPGEPVALYRFVRHIIIEHRQFMFAMILVLQALLANYLAFVLRFEAILPPVNLGQFLAYLPFLLAIRLFFHVYAGLYKNLWRYADIKDLVDIVWTSAAGEVFFAVIVMFLFGNAGYPRTIYVLDFMLFVAISGGTRLLIRIFNEYMKTEPSLKKVLIVGAGDGGELVVRQMKGNKDSSHRYEPVGFIDDKKHMKGLSIHGVPILGAHDSLPEMIRKYRPEEVLVSTPCDPQRLKTIYELCKPHDVHVKKLPALDEILNGDVSIAPKIGHLLISAGLITEKQLLEAFSLQKAEGGRLGEKLMKMGLISEKNLVTALKKQYSSSRMKPLSLEDLLHREPVRADIRSVREFIEGKTVFVTGAGGSIGSELCRQIMKYCPQDLVLFDRYENSLFHIDRELRGCGGNGHDGHLSTVIGDIQDARYLEHLFSKHRPEVIFHAAAYKHVPLMEFNPVEAVKNNVLGTRNLLQAADRFNAERFVAISTDKAVNPTSIMGATKRIAEFLTIGMNRTSSARFSVVRFGNVLGTNGSVVPIFKEQLRKGGPLTVTHPEIKRFFMLVPEAMQLVLIAGSAGHGGEIFVLDMGEPVKILDLAENFIRLSGLVPHKEIKIEFSGLRPGEKLYEELFDSEEKVLPTFHEKLRMAVSAIPSAEELAAAVGEFEEAVRDLSAESAVAGIRKIVPNFQSALPEPEGLLKTFK